MGRKGQARAGAGRRRKERGVEGRKGEKRKQQDTQVHLKSYESVDRAPQSFRKILQKLIFKPMFRLRRNTQTK